MLVLFRMAWLMQSIIISKDELTGFVLIVIRIGELIEPISEINVFR